MHLQSSESPILLSAPRVAGPGGWGSLSQAQNHKYAKTRAGLSAEPAPGEGRALGDTPIAKGESQEPTYPQATGF